MKRMDSQSRVREVIEWYSDRVIRSARPRPRLLPLITLSRITYHSPTSPLSAYQAIVAQSPPVF